MASEASEGLLVDVGTGVVRRDHVLVHKSAVAVVVMGFGPRAEQLRRFACAETADEDEDDPFLARCDGLERAVANGQFAKARQGGIPRPVLRIADRTLRRLAVAEALAKAGFNPDEPRDERGRWTSDGRGSNESGGASEGGGTSEAAALAGAAAADDFAASLAGRGAWAFAGELASETLLGLALIAERFSGPAAFLGTLFIPSNSNLRQQGSIPGRPDIAFDYDEDTGILKLSRDGALFYAGQSQNGLFRDGSHVFGRNVAGNIVLDPDALPVAARVPDAIYAPASAPVLADIDADRTEPKLCPAKTTEETKGRSAQAMAYQEQITQLPPGFDIKLIDPQNGGPVSFDGCCTPANPYCPPGDDYLLEAKAEQYQKFMLNPREWKTWFRGAKGIEVQMERQNRTAVATGWRVLWFFAERGPADFFADFARKKELLNIEVDFIPAVQP